MDTNTYDFCKNYFVKRINLYGELTRIKFFDQIWKAYETIDKSLKSGNKLLIFGNGGSAAEAQHFAAELVCRFEKKRRALSAIALTTDTSIITAQSNDFNFDSIFARQIEALGHLGDIAIGLTTSDSRINFSEKEPSHSLNMLQGFVSARAQGMHTIGLVSQKTSGLLSLIDYPIVIPHENTAIIQEAHLSVLHLLCKLIEENLLPHQ